LNLKYILHTRPVIMVVAGLGLLVQHAEGVVLWFTIDENILLAGYAVTLITKHNVNHQ